MSKLAAASGLYCLEQGRYKAAALKFTEATLAAAAGLQQQAASNAAAVAPPGHRGWR